ncbi:MAG: PQQ-dependent sugar dehydrogenase [Candidatus Andersenbacteria bacterium]
MRRLWLGLGILLGAVVFLGVYGYQQLGGIGPVLQPPNRAITQLLDNAEGPDFPLSLPPNFSIAIFARDLPGARVLVRDGRGNFWVSQTDQGTISLLEVNDNQVTSGRVVWRNLDNPHGLAIDPHDPLMLYFAEEGAISRVPLYREAVPEEIADLPRGGGHSTRTLGFGPDDRLYVSIGSSCNVCYEQDSRRSKIFSLNRDGSQFQEVASGLRNAVFFTWSYVDGRMWATEMGRDLLGDDTPPDEINIIEAGKDYGWPTCYGKNIWDTTFDRSAAARARCAQAAPSLVDLQAHSAPLGLAFVPEEGWPEEYWYDLLVAYHGSWNRREPTGYKVVRVKLDEQGRYQGTEDFISGWLQDGNALGRPVDVRVEPGGVLYITDDKAGVIYRVIGQP